MLNLPVVIAYQNQVDYHNSHADGSPYSAYLNDPSFQSIISGCVPLDSWSRGYPWMESPFGTSHYTVAFPFQSLGDLASQINRPISLRGTFQGICDDSISTNTSIRKLIIDAHGDPGVVYFGGLNSRNLAIHAGNIQENESFLRQIFRRVMGGGSVMFTSCHTGQGEAGNNLLRNLSTVAWGKRVIAFSTYNINVISQDRRVYYSEQEAEQAVTGERIRTHAELNEHNPNAKIYLNGDCIQMPSSETTQSITMEESTVIRARPQRRR